jgi:hypothetical protein
LETELETAYGDTLETSELEGYTYRMLAQHTEKRSNFAMSEEMTVEVLQDAINHRKLMTMETLNIDIKEIGYADLGDIHCQALLQNWEDIYRLEASEMQSGLDMLMLHSHAEGTTIPAE